MVEIMNGILGGACGALFAYIIEKLFIKELDLIMGIGDFYLIVKILLFVSCILCGIVIAIKFTTLLKSREVLKK